MRPSQKDLFEECSRTQLRVKDDEMILPRGVTGFWSVNAAPLPLLDEKAFCQMCYSIALENGGTVTELDTDTYPRNFYSVKLSRHDQSVFVAEHPLSLCGLCSAGHLRWFYLDQPAGVAPAAGRIGEVSESQRTDPRLA